MPVVEDFDERYEDLAPIDSGGMGEVRRVRERRLGRILAMKIIRADLAADRTAHARFAEEARTTACLEHPSIIPVHDVGLLPDGRLYYTMPEVRGRTLARAIRDVHAFVLGRSWRPTPTGWTFRRLVDGFRRACDAVAYAHEHGIVHGDLKPDNVMLGPNGEVYVLDWGLARIVDPRKIALADEPASRALLGFEEPLEPQEGIAGTMAYMAPERLWNGPDELQVGADVYALGAVLYEILTGESPYGPGDVVSVLQKLAEGPPAPVADLTAERERPEPPADLVDVVEAAMAREPSKRPSSARSVTLDVGAWIEGTRQLEHALTLVDRARGLRRQVEQVWEQVRAWRDEAAGMLRAIPRHAPPERKEPAWELQARARELEVRAVRLDAELTQSLRAALAMVPEMTEAHDMLADHYKARHEAAEERGDAIAAERDAIRLKHHDRSQRYGRYLRGVGALTLVTDPPGAEVVVFRYEEMGRRLVPRRFRSLGRTPLQQEALAMGSYLVVLRAEGCAEVRYPVRIDRCGRWDGVPPTRSRPLPVFLPLVGSIGADHAYVPGGYFRCGGDPEAPGSLPRQDVWIDGFVMQRHPVTHGQFLAFLNALVAQGDTEEALRLAPRAGGVGGVGEGEMLYGRAPDGRFTAEGGNTTIEVVEDRPVVCVAWGAAQVYAAHLANREGHAWRLPGELEWEKAARGVDGRFFPWGDHLDATWCCMRDSHPERPGIAAVGEFTGDESPHGVRGLAGNVRDWCADAFRPDGPILTDGRWIPSDLVVEGLPRVGRGGTWCVNPVGLRAAYRSWYAPTFRSDDSIGFRLVCSYPDGWIR